MKFRSFCLVAMLASVASQAQAAGPSLGTAQGFAVLGGSTVTNTGSTILTGDLGVWPGLAITGFPPGIDVGTTHTGDAVAQQAQSDVTTAYNALAGMMTNTDLTGQDLGGQTLTAGVYNFSTSAQLTGTLTLNAQGDPNAVFVFKIGSTLTTASNSLVALTNSANGCNVFWQVGSSATLGTTTAFQGNILALASITLNTGAAILNGRALARNGAVTLDTNTVVTTHCIPGVNPPCPVTCPGNIDANNTLGMCCAPVTYTTPFASESCGPTTCLPISGSCFPVGVTTVTCTSHDSLGAIVDVCAFTITVHDTELPTITCPQVGLTFTDPGQCSAVVNFTATATDNCAGPVTVACTPQSGSTFPIGTNTVNCTATDAAGNTASCSFGFFVLDHEPPGIQCPGDITQCNDPGQCSAVVTYTVPTSDNCPATLQTVMCDLPSGSTFPIGSTTVHCGVFDAAQNGAFCQFTVQVNDCESPVLTCPANITVSNDTDLCSAVVTYLPPQLTDNCPVPTDVVVGCTPPSGSTFPVGQTTVNCSATSAAGVVVATCSFTVTVNDTQPPVVVCQNATLQAGACGNVSYEPSDLVQTFTDNCCTTGEGAGITFSPPFLECPPLNTPITVTVTATDCHGNTATCTATVTVEGDDCNNNGFDDACDICNGTSLDCNCDGIPDECICCWDNGRIQTPAAIPTGPLVNGELSHEGGGAQDASRVADDVYFCPGQIHKVTAFFGQMITNSFHNAQVDFRHARLDVFADCDGKPVQTPFKSFTNSQIIASVNLPDGYTLVTYRFDLCDEHLWLDGGTWWFSLVGLSDNLNNEDVSFWAATTPDPNPAGLIGSVPVRATGTRNPIHWMTFDYGPWVPISDCCLGCVNMAFWLSCEECECIWDNGPADLDPLTKGGSPSGAAGPNEAETADQFVVKPCEDRWVCLIQAWVWSNCLLTQDQLDHPCDCAFINLYRNDCNLPALTNPCYLQLRPTRIRALPNTTTIDNRLVHLYCLEFETNPCGRFDIGGQSSIGLYAGSTYWISAGIHGNGTIATRSYFAFNSVCPPACPIRILPGVNRTISSTGIISDWTRTTHDYAFRITAKPLSADMVANPGGQGQPGGGGPPACAVDINHDGVATIGDIFAFLGVWFAGCP